MSAAPMYMGRCRTTPMLTATIPNQNARRCAKAIIGPPEMADSLRGIYGNDRAGDSRRITRLLGLARLGNAVRFGALGRADQLPARSDGPRANPAAAVDHVGSGEPPAGRPRVFDTALFMDARSRIAEGECVIGPRGPGKVTQCPVWRAWWAAE